MTLEASVMIHVELGMVLAVQRKSSQLWCLPGGKLLPNEPPIVAAQREFTEETGLTCISCAHFMSIARPDKEGGEGNTHFYVTTAQPIGVLKAEPGTYVKLVQWSLLLNSKTSAFPKTVKLLTGCI
jgi:8-oxo-dGTP pyrophosphatase MutT (NUDIX family)